jgi:hypothetical protein
VTTTGIGSLDDEGHPLIVDGLTAEVPAELAG